MNPLGLVVAAGKSTRMGGFPKPLLTFDGNRFIEGILAQYTEAGIDEQLVVLGHEAETVTNAIEWGNTSILVNPDYESGMLSSVQLGVSEAKARNCDGVFLWPTDFACVPAAIITKLMTATAETNADVVLPAYNGERGHPALFTESTFDDLLTAPDDEGARAVVYDPETSVAEYQTDDPRVLVDIDTPEEYWDAVKRYELGHTPSKEA